MKNFKIVIVLLVCLVAFSACGCSHESWISSDNGEKICENCEILYCEVNGHTWFAADCENPKSCENCSLTEGEPNGHSWTEADCLTAKTCSACKLTEGKALGHKWLEATTESPKTCEICKLNEGGRIITDERFKTAKCSMLFGKWEGLVELSGEDFQDGFSKYLKVFRCVYVLEFSNDGELAISFYPENMEEFNSAMCEYMKDYIYSEFAALGFGTAAVDEYVVSTYGMSMDEYVASEIEALNISDLFSSMAVTLTYYVNNDQLYTGFSWNLMEPSEFSVEGDTLNYPIDGEMVPFTKVA